MAQRPHPKFPPQGAHIRGPLIWAHALLETDAACSRLLAMYEAAAQRNPSADTPRKRALWTAYWSLKTTFLCTARDAQAAGVLLYAWHGTTAFFSAPKGGAA